MHRKVGLKRSTHHLISYFFLTICIPSINAADNYSKCLSLLIPQTSAQIQKHPELTLQKNNKSISLIWRKRAPIKFSELILSWNASRPKRGKFSFWLNVRHHNWSGWKKIAEWGKNSQKTFCNIRQRYVHVKHVRLEMQRGRLGFDFQIKIIAEDGANMQRLRALFVNLANERNFVVHTNRLRLPSKCITTVPKQSQWLVPHNRQKDICSPTSVSMITHNFMIKNKQRVTCDLKEQAKQIACHVRDKSLNIHGCWPFNVAEAYNITRGQVLYRVQRLNNFGELYRYIKRNIPVAVSIRGHLRGCAWPYNNGHFVVVIGWDQKKQSVICLDPAFRDQNHIQRNYPIRDFARAWGKSRNLAYVSIPKRKLT